MGVMLEPRNNFETKTTVGAGLPAMAAEQSPLMVADTSLSLASQLPQFFR
jgi:hypothetical protein